MNGERIKLARKRAGFSLRALADQMDGLVSAQAIGKYEREEMIPGSDVLIALTKALDVSLSYLMSPQGIKLGEVEFRKKSTTSAKERARVETIVLESVERYLQIEEILELDSSKWSCPKNMPKPISKLEDAEELADKVRKAWNIGTDPIPNMTSLLEEKGIKVLLEDLPEKVSGLTCLVQREKRFEVPVIVVNRKSNLERRRFTLAHELAHRVIETRRNNESLLEKLCNRFAGAFLVPRNHLVKEVGEVRNSFSFQEICDLKHSYRVSALSLLIRFEQVGIIEKHDLNYAFRTFAKGWRTKEPEPIEEPSLDIQNLQEKPIRFERLVFRALAEDMIGQAKAAELLRRPIKEIESGLKWPEHEDNS